MLLYIIYLSKPCFKLLVYLDIRAYLTILLKSLYYYNFLLLEEPFYFYIIAFYRVFIEFLFKLL